MQSNAKRIAGILAYLIIGLFLVYKFPDTTNDPDLFWNYIVLCTSYFYVAGIFLIMLLNNRVEVFEPFTVLFILYILLYTITPIVLIWQNNTLCWGTDVMGGCIKATFIYMASFSIYAFVYFNRIQIGPRMTSYVPEDENEIVLDITGSRAKRMLQVAYFMYAIFLVVSLWFMMHCGYSISYILTLGLSSNAAEQVSYSSLAFLENVIYGLIPLWLYICLLSKSRFMKFITGFIPFAMFMIRGFRFVIVIQIIAAIICYYKVKNKKPKGSTIFIMGVLFLGFITIMGFTRNAVRTGAEIDWSSFGLDTLEYALYSNFNIYQIYYGLVDAMPDRVPFIYFQSMIDSMAVFIPRAIWPSKPLAAEVASIQVMMKAINAFVIQGAYMATPDLGAYYMSFGTFGCLAYSTAWGILSRRIKAMNYLNKNNVHKIIIYSIFTIVIFYTITRGGDLFNIVKKMIFFFLPIFILQAIDNGDV